MTPVPELPAPVVPPGPATMRDVARAAGVSSQTVSRVVNGAPEVRDSTRRRVLATIELLDYRLNDAASRLARGPRRRAADHPRDDACAVR